MQPNQRTEIAASRVVQRLWAFRGCTVAVLYGHLKCCSSRARRHIFLFLYPKVQPPASSNLYLLYGIYFIYIYIYLLTVYLMVGIAERLLILSTSSDHWMYLFFLLRANLINTLGKFCLRPESSVVLLWSSEVICSLTCCSRITLETLQ